MSAPPIPPRTLARYVVGGVDGDDWAAQFDAVGREVAAALLPLTPREALRTGGRLLDFGCGSGRILRHLLDAGDGELHGCDIHAPSVAWVAAHLPRAVVAVAPERPPLPYPDGHFDAVWAVSVFSQLADGWAEWLLELRRITKPGGTVILTLMGPAAAPAVTGRPVTDDEVGMRVHGAGQPWEAGGPMVVHGSWWVAEHYGRAFTVVAQHAAAAYGQDVVVLRRPPADVPAPDADALRSPASGEPRELAALDADARRLLADLAELNRRHDAYAAAYAAEAARVADLERQLAAVAGRRRTWFARRHGQTPD